MQNKTNILEFPKTEGYLDLRRIEELLSQILEATRTPFKERPLTREEAAAYLQIHPDSVYKLARANKITYHRLGDGERQPLRFYRKDLDEFLSAGKIAALN